jgi:hypothetical protein
MSGAETMKNCITVGELLEKLDGVPSDLPVMVFSLTECEPYPVGSVDLSITGRVELNFADWAGGES